MQELDGEKPLRAQLLVQRVHDERAHHAVVVVKRIGWCVGWDRQDAKGRGAVRDREHRLTVCCAHMRVSNHGMVHCPCTRRGGVVHPGGHVGCVGGGAGGGIV